MVESNYRILTRLYQHIYSDIAHIYFFEYIHSYIDPDEIHQLDEDIKTNGWCVCVCVCVGMIHVQTYKISWPGFYAIFRHRGLFFFLEGGMLRCKEQNMH